VLNDAGLREQLDAAAADIDDDSSRASRAITLGSARRARRRRTRAAVATLAVVAGVAALPALLSGGHPAAPPTSAAIACEAGRTVINTPRVASLSSGAVITIRNDTPESVVVHLGDETAVVAPGVSEGQFPLSPGRQTVQCVSGGSSTAARSIAVVAQRHA
jgi:hypothetical protein